LKTHFSNQDFQNNISEEDKAEELITPVSFNQIWAAAELLISPELSKRKKGFERLIELDAVKQYPIIVYLLASKLSEPDFSLRSFYVRVLAGLLDESITTSDQLQSSRLILVNYLSQISTEEVISLLELAEVDPPSKDCVVQLLCLCACAGDQLKNIVINRDRPMELRMISLEIIGKVGYLEAISDFERMEKRLKNKGSLDSSNSMESEFLKKLETTIQLLKAP
jgi:hypothetical protein